MTRAAILLISDSTRVLSTYPTMLDALRTWDDVRTTKPIQVIFGRQLPTGIFQADAFQNLNGFPGAVPPRLITTSQYEDLPCS